MHTSSQAITVFVSHKANGVLFLYTSSSSSFLKYVNEMIYEVHSYTMLGISHTHFLRLSFSDALEVGDDPIPLDEFS